MNRRSVLAIAGLALSSSISGCSSAGRSTPQCHLTHEVMDPADAGVEVIETYRYEELSDEAKHVVESAAADGSYATTDRSLEPPEFSYGDTVSAYNVTYQNETHVLLTYSGEGCERE